MNSVRGTFNTRIKNGEHPIIPTTRKPEARMIEARLTNPRMLAHFFIDRTCTGCCTGERPMRSRPSEERTT